MNANEYREIIARLGLTQEMAALLVGVNARTSRRWALGEQDVNETAARLLTLLVVEEISPHQAMKHFGVAR